MDFVQKRTLNHNSDVMLRPGLITSSEGYIQYSSCLHRGILCQP